jgi:hypothetical protein
MYARRVAGIRRSTRAEKQIKKKKDGDELNVEEESRLLLKFDKDP